MTALAPERSSLVALRSRIMAATTFASLRAPARAHGRADGHARRFAAVRARHVGRQPAMLVLAAAAALVSAVFVSSQPRTAPRLAPHACDRGCALPIVPEEA